MSKLAKQLITRIGFTKGVKPAFDPAIIPPESLWKGYNIRTDVDGVLRIRTGYDSINASLGIYGIQALTSAFGNLYGVWQQKLYKFDDVVATPVSDTLITKNNSDVVDIVNWAEGGSSIAYIFSGNGLYQTDGDTVGLVTPYATKTGEAANLLDNTTTNDIAKCNTALIRVSFSQRFVATGNPDSPNEIYLSAPFNAGYFPVDQVIKLPDDGGKIIGLIAWYGAIIIFRDKDIYMFSGSDLSDPEAMLVLQSHIGCVARKTIVGVPDYGIVFLGADNVYKLTGVTAIEHRVTPLPISKDVTNVLQESMKSGVEGACAIFWDNTYRLSLPKHNISTFLLKDTWNIDTGQPIGSFAVHNGELYGGNWYAGEVFKFNNSLFDNQIGYQMSAITKRDIFPEGKARITRMFLYVLHGVTAGTLSQYFFGDSFNEQMFNAPVIKEITADRGSIQNLKISIMVDNNEYQVEDFKISAKKIYAPDTDLGLPLQVYEKRFSPMLKGSSAQVKLESLNLGEDISVLGYALEVITPKYMKGKVV